MSSNSPTTRLGTEGSKNNPHFGSRLSPNPSPDLSQPNRSMSLTTAKRKYTIPSLEDHNMTAALHEIDSLSSFVPAGKKPVLARVVLTGGPCGGKTTVQNTLREFFTNLGWKVYCVPEAATILMGGGVKFYDLNQDQIASFQDSLLKLMLRLEDTYIDLASVGDDQDQNVMVLCDRGTMDPSAYMGRDAWQQILHTNNWSPVELRDIRYDMVVHLVTAADGAEPFYSLANNATRSEGADLAKEVDTKTMKAWNGHPYLHVVDNRTNFKDKVNRVVQLICKRYGLDYDNSLSARSVKRKFLVSAADWADQIPISHETFEVLHEFIQTTDGSQVRLRRRGIDGNYAYGETIRTFYGGTSDRSQSAETRRNLTHRHWAALRRQIDPTRHPVHKKRLCFLYEKQYYQLDVYQEPCAECCKGLILLETSQYVPTSHEGSELPPLALPPFVPVIKEVTKDKSYSMYNLAHKKD